MSVELAYKVAKGDIDPSVSKWLCYAFGEYLAGRASLETALGLDRARRVRERNAALLRAAAVIKGRKTLSPWALAGMLANAIKRFERRALPVWSTFPRGKLSELNRAILEALEASTRIPRTQRKLYELLI